MVSHLATCQQTLYINYIIGPNSRIIFIYLFYFVLRYTKRHKLQKYDLTVKKHFVHTNKHIYIVDTEVNKYTGHVTIILILHH